MPFSLDTWVPSELDGVVDVLNTASTFDRFRASHMREAIFADVDFDPALLSCARSDGQIVAAAAAVLRRPRGAVAPASSIGYVKLFAVAPAWQGRGIGSQLLAEVERKLSEGGAQAIRVFGDAPFYLRPGVDFRLTPLVCLLLRRGYKVRSNAVNMEVDLATADLETASDEARLRDLGIDIRRLEAEDATAFRAYMERDWSWGWTIEACRSLDRSPISTHVALQQGQIVGFASHSASGPGQFGPMGVKPELRQHGIGAVLLKRCLADLRAGGYPTADIQWVGPICFYHRHVGAVLSRCFWQFEKGPIPSTP
jgi:mycothiol synthase